jgi:sulfide:quinone oxidoreductase
MDRRVYLMAHVKEMSGRPQGSGRHRRIVIAGGGVAGVEALLALRDQLEIAELHLIAPSPQFVYQPLAVALPFDRAGAHLWPLAEIARDQGATLHVDSVTEVDAEDRLVRLASGPDLTYDALVLAVGARRREWLDGALHFGGVADAPRYREMLASFESGVAQRLAFVSPPDCGWTLPLYELALLTASRFAESGVIGVQLTVITSEPAPLAVFGPAAGRMLRGILADRGITLKAATYTEAITDGELRLRPGRSLGVDHVVTLPQLEGRAPAGIPCDPDGFVEVGEDGRVPGLEGVYAAGDGTTFPVKQGGIATQQADAVAEAIAAQMGAAVTPEAVRPTLRAMLLTGIAPTYLRAGLSGASGDPFELGTEPLWWPPSKVAGRYLAPYLTGRAAPHGAEQLQDRPESSADPTRLAQAHDEARELALAFAERDAADGHFDSALDWLEVIERLDGVLVPACALKRAQWRAREEPAVDPGAVVPGSPATAGTATTS